MNSKCPFGLLGDYAGLRRNVSVANTRDSSAHMLIRSRVVDMMFPMPTSGETIPPNRKPDAPKMAEAVPIIWRPSSMASVVADVRIKPKPISIRKVRIS